MPGAIWEINNPQFAEDGAIWFANDWGRFLSRLGPDGAFDSWSAEKLIGIKAGYDAGLETSVVNFTLLSANRVLVLSPRRGGARIFDHGKNFITYVNWKESAPAYNSKQNFPSSRHEGLIFF